MSIRDICKSYGSRQILDSVNFGMDSKAKVGLVGSNGSGKSTLLKIILGFDEPDKGEVHRNKSIKFGYLSQEPQFENKGSLFDVVLSDQKKVLNLLKRFEQMSLEVAEDPNKLKQLEELQAALEACDGWNLENEVRQSLALMGFRDLNRSIAGLSGGEQKKIALARLFMQKPDFMLLDEPTNHLDTQTIEWLENRLKDFEGALLLITHDRYFLQRVTDKIAEIDRGILRVYEGNYDRYLESKAHQAEVEQRTRHNQIRFLQREYQWMQKMPRARGTKSKSRIQTFEKVKTQLSPKIVPLEEFQFGLAHRLGDRVLEWNQLGKFYDEWLFRNSCHKMLEKERLGITGRNGAGKSTLLKVLLGELQPDEGSVLPGSNTRFCYFDQQRIHLDPEKTVLQSFEEYGETIQTDRGRMHIKAFLERFLFNRDRLSIRIEKLSGGEKARLMLARMVANPGNLMILDEPTNDLDLDTLRFLEEALAAYPGCAIVVSHDRYFLDRVCTSIMEIGEQNTPLITAGNYSFLQWIKQQNKEKEKSHNHSNNKSSTVKQKSNETSRNKKKFGNKQDRRLKEIELEIQALEEKQTELKIKLENPAGDNSINYAELGHELNQFKALLEDLYQEWEELESLRIQT